MTIRNYLLRAFIPGLVVFTLSISTFFYLHHSYILTLQPTVKSFETVAGIIAAASFLYLLVRIYLFSSYINKPLQILKDDALAIAAGDFRTSDKIKQPAEIKELAITMQTMAECLQENMARMRESSALRERMHGEYECAVLLQHYMLANVIDEFKSERMHIRPITYRSASTPHGVLLKLEPTTITLLESDKNGFEGMYELLTAQQGCTKQVQLSLQNNFTKVVSTAKNLPEPVIWSTHQDKMIPLSNGMATIEKDDLIFLYNEGFAKCFENPEHVQKWFHKVLRHFASEGIELFLTMLNCEITFLTKKLHIDHDINILCIQIT